jgi:hypothetical protein
VKFSRSFSFGVYKYICVPEKKGTNNFADGNSRRSTAGLPPPARVCILRAVPLSWNEIRHRAITFAREWKGETREAAERQTFWNEFFNVFGVRRRTVATFEEPVKKLSGDWGLAGLLFHDPTIRHFNNSL